MNEVSLLYTIEKFPKIGKKSSASAVKWIERTKYKSSEEMCSKLKQEGYKIFASTLNENAVDFYSLDLTEKIAFVFGNEHRGISKEIESLADKCFFIPMYGMVQSLNVSVACAVVLYEALRQRKSKGMYPGSLAKEEIEKLVNHWLRK